MAAPALVARLDPRLSGVPLLSGWRSKIAFNLAPGLVVFEKEVTPPGLDIGEEVDTSTMWNSLYRTKYAGTTINEVTPVKVKVAYDPVAWSTLTGIVGVNDSISITFPNDDDITFWGYIKSFTPGEMKEKAQPEADMEIVVTNWDDFNCVEAAPVFTEASGTC